MTENDGNRPAAVEPRRGSPSPRLDEAEFKRRYRQHFLDPAFAPLKDETERIAEVAWEAYRESRKSPLTQRAGHDFAEPDYQLSVDWLRAKAAINEAKAEHQGGSQSRALIISGSSRSEHTCPSEVSKSFRLAELAADVIRTEFQIEVEQLDLSRLASEYGREIHPCKACFSTAAPLCHWPCSCYPNHSLGQIHDWMNDIYPMWVRAHGVMIVTPVNWYHTSSPIKLMMDRLVCADGGNPDPSLTGGKDAARAKAIELAGWDYPRHLAGRVYSVIVHGDVEGAENTRRSLSDWLRSMKLESAGGSAELDRYIGYWKPYATNHEELDRDSAIQEEVRNAARTLAEAMRQKREGRRAADAELAEPRQK